MGVAQEPCVCVSDGRTAEVWHRWATVDRLHM